MTSLIVGAVGCDAANERPADPDRSPWADVSREPILELGTDPEDPAHQFDRVVGSFRTAEGVVVADGSQTIRFFSESGELIRTVGGRGSGPGEFEALAFVQQHEDGRIIAWDFAQARLTTWTAMGEVVRTVTLQPDPEYPPLLVPDAVFADGSVLTMAGPPVDREFEDGRWGAITLVRLSIEGEVLNSLGEFRLQPCREGQENCGRAYRPFRAAWAAVGEHLYYAQPDRPEVWMYDLDGNEVGRLQGPSSEGVVGDSVPVYSDLIGDGDGNLWARAGDDTGQWFVFEPSAGYVGWVEMPPNLDVGQIGQEFVLGVEPDELRVERVRMYRLAVDGG